MRIGHEVEEVITLGPVDGPLTVGRVTAIEELTEFKKPIRACKVDVGEAAADATSSAAQPISPSAIWSSWRCPAPPCPADFTIAARKTYGRNSDGMICSAAELGLGADHAGILVLPPGHRRAREPTASTVLGLDDVVFDLAITPDRGYCMSVRGMAREIACAYDLDFVDPADVSRRCRSTGEAWPLTVQPGTGRAPIRAAPGHRNRPGRACRRGGCSAGCCCAASGRSRRRST